MNEQEMLDFVKALANADRLKIVGILVQKPASLAEVATALSLPVRETFNHLAFLEFIGVVHKSGECYELSVDGLEKLTRQQFEGQPQPVALQSALPADEPRAKVLKAFLKPDGTIRQIPNSRTQPAKFRIVLDYVLAAFQPGVIYTEKEVNTLIRRFHLDVSGLRRDLIDAGLLERKRDGSQYWRPSEQVEERPA